MPEKVVLIASKIDGKCVIQRIKKLNQGHYLMKNESSRLEQVALPSVFDIEEYVIVKLPSLII